MTASPLIELILLFFIVVGWKWILRGVMLVLVLLLVAVVAGQYWPSGDAQVAFPPDSTIGVWAPGSVSTMDEVKTRWRQVGATVAEDVLAAAATACITLEAADKALRAGEECRSAARILVVGGDAMEAAEHDLKAVRANPGWRVLTYESGATKKASGVPAAWYNQVRYEPVTHGVCGTQPRSTTTVQVYDCQEYPYYATVEGGPAPAYGPPAAVDLIKGTDNRREGKIYSAMVNSKVCHMQNMTSRFLVVPVPDPAVPSFGLCSGAL